MKNYTIKPTKAHGIFTLEDKNGNLIADVRGKDLAEQFAALPEILDALEDLMIAQNGPPLIRDKDGYFEAYERCNVILGKFNSGTK